MSLRQFIFGAAACKRFTITTFTANGNWTCPGGLTTVRKIEGKGGPASGDFADSSTIVGGGIQSVDAGENAPSADWASPYGEINTARGQFAAAIGGIAPSGVLTYVAYYIDSGNRWTYRPLRGQLNGVYVSSVSAVAAYGGTTPTSGVMAYADVPASPNLKGWSFDISYVTLAAAGTASTGLGKSFPGGTYAGSFPTRVAVAAVLTSFDNVTVVPGTVYPIVVPSGGYVTLTYTS